MNALRFTRSGRWNRSYGDCQHGQQRSTNFSHASLERDTMPRITHPTTWTKVRTLSVHCLLLLTLVCLTGCALTNSKKSAARAPTVHGDKFSCGEQCPKGRSL